MKSRGRSFAASWNLGNTATRAIDSDSVKEVGCIQTSQGLDFNYVGVIIGDDLRYVNGRIITDYRKKAKTDKSIFGLKGKCDRGDPEALKRVDTIIRNTYRTLLTRGMKGCYIYCTDKALSEYIKKRIQKTRDHMGFVIPNEDKKVAERE